MNLNLDHLDLHMINELRGVLNENYSGISKITRETASAFQSGTRKEEVYEYLFKGRTLKTIKFFLSDKTLSKKELTDIFGVTLSKYLIAIGVAEKKKAGYRSSVHLFSFRDYFFITDRDNRMKDDVVFLTREQEFLLDLTPKNNKSVLDVCTGSGVIAVLLAKSSEKVTAVDINPRAIRFARYNAALNDVRVEFILSDLYEHVNSKYDLIVSNPPFNPFFGGKRILSEHSGLSGEDAMFGIIRGIPRYLNDDGICQMIGRFFYKEEFYWGRLENIIDLNKYDLCLLMGKHPRDVFKLLNIVEGAWSVKKIKDLMDYYKKEGISREAFGILNLKKGTGRYLEKVVDLFDRYKKITIPNFRKN